MDIDLLPALAGLSTYQILDALADEKKREETYERLLAAAKVNDEQAARAREAQEILDRQAEADAAPTFVNAQDFMTQPVPEWDDYIGQKALKDRLMLSIRSAKMRGTRLDHTLLASGMPGVGKTTIARIIAKMMGGNIVELVPKISVESMIAAAESLNDGDILFIDEIHKLAETGKRGAEVLLKLLEDGVIYLDGVAHEIADITVIGATTDVDMLPETVKDRFKIKPYFEKYTEEDLARITCQFMERHGYHYTPEDDTDLIWGIAEACRSTPRVCEEFVMAVRDLHATTGVKPKITTVLACQQVEPDGMTRQHIAYLTNMYRYNKRTVKERVEWVAGEAVMMSMLRETKQGVQRIERFLMESGYIDRTPSGRRLTPAGVDKARRYIKRGF